MIIHKSIIGFNPRIIRVIEYKELVGSGTEKDPYRRIIRHLDFDGNTIASGDDPCADNETLNEKENHNEPLHETN